MPAAMAISGAALSPLTGRVTGRTRPVRLLLAFYALPRSLTGHHRVADRLADRDRDDQGAAGNSR